MARTTLKRTTSGFITNEHQDIKAFADKTADELLKTFPDVDCSDLLYI